MDQDQNGKRNGQEVEFEAFALLAAEPIHEETVVDMDGENGTDHERGDAEPSQARQETKEHAQAAKKLHEDHEKHERDRHAHSGEGTDGTREAEATKPAEQLLRSMSKENDAQKKAGERKGKIILGAE